MRTFKEGDSNISRLNAGDTLEMKDGTKHEAVSTYHVYGDICEKCSMFRNNCYGLNCGAFNFKLQSNEQS